ASSTVWYDDSKDFYRCFYGGINGRTAHINFHIRKGTRLYMLPVDTDLDGVPYLRGYRDDVYNDNCPFDYNPGQDSEVCREQEEDPEHNDDEDNYEDSENTEDTGSEESEIEDSDKENSEKTDASKNIVDHPVSERGCSAILI
ncbi:MAG: hypothetical protein R6W70_02195, partial [bacterium]